MFIGVSGAAGLGKSTLSIELISWFKRHYPEIKAGALPLDSFMLDRANRLVRNLSGYDPRANDLDGVISAVQTLSHGISVEYFPYNHVTGRHEEQPQYLEPLDIIVIDGTYAFQPRILPLLSYKIFLYAPPSVAKELRFLTDLLERNYTVHKAFAHADEEYNNFERFMLPYIKFADQVVEIDGYWRYKL